VETSERTAPVAPFGWRVTSNARRPALAGSPDALHPATGHFPLGRPFGMLPPGGGTSRPDALPFGLRQAITPPATIGLGDLDQYGYDRERQIGVAFTPDGAVPLARHTTGQTRTVTHPDGKKGPDSDADQRED
jgi:putative ATP-grasp target RiPP